jgi:hypothetical protein
MGATGEKALSCEDLHFDMSAYALRTYRKVVFSSLQQNLWVTDRHAARAACVCRGMAGQKEVSLKVRLGGGDGRARSAGTLLFAR